MDDATVERVVCFLVTCGHDDEVHLPGLGWLSARQYKAYEGRDPRTGALKSGAEKYLPFFRVDPELQRAINGLDELATSARPLGGDAGEPTSERSYSAARLPGADELSAEIRRTLVSDGRVDVPALGTFEIVEKDGRPGVNPHTGERIQIPARRIARFKASDQLKARLAEKK